MVLAICLQHNLDRDETIVGVNKKLELWRSFIEYKGFRFNRTKMECKYCDFSNTKVRERGMSLNGLHMLHWHHFDT